MTPRMSPAEAAERVPDGAVVALGGVRLQRKPMALARALVDAGRRDLRAISFLGSVDIELLLAGGCVAEVHSAGVSLDAAGLAPRFRSARQSGSPRFVEWSEGTLLMALEAASRGVPSLPTWMALGSDLPKVNPWLRPGSDPFDDTEVMHVRALRPDIALLHVPAIDEHGDVYVDGDLAGDGLIARAAAQTFVSYEEECAAVPLSVALSRLWVGGLVEARRGAWPGGCHPRYGVDFTAVSRWAREGADAGPDLMFEEASA